MAGFSPLETPSFSQAALGGYQAGRAMGQQRRRDEALAAYGKDPDTGITALETVDPALTEQLRANRDSRKMRDAYGRVFAPPAALGGTAPASGGEQALGAPPVFPMTPPAGTSPQLSSEANAMIPGAAPAEPIAAPTPTAGGINVNMAALQELASLGPEGAKGAQAIYGLIQSGNEAKIKAFASHAEMRGQLAMYLKTLPPEQRAAAYEAALPELTARGFIPQAVQGMRFDDAMLDRDVAFAVPTLQALTQAREDRKERAAAADRTADNARADRGLAVREGALGLARERAKGGGKGGRLSGPGLGEMSDDALMAIATGQN